MCAGPVFSLVFFSQSCGVFHSCHISTVTVLIRGSRELPGCFVVWQFVFAQQKNMYQAIFMRCTIIGFSHGCSRCQCVCGVIASFVQRSCETCPLTQTKSRRREMVAFQHSLKFFPRQHCPRCLSASHHVNDWSRFALHVHCPI